MVSMKVSSPQPMGNKVDIDTRELAQAAATTTPDQPETETSPPSSRPLAMRQKTAAEEVMENNIPALANKEPHNAS